MSEQWHIEAKPEYPTSYRFILNDQGETIAMVAYSRLNAEAIVADHGAAARLEAAQESERRLRAALEYYEEPTHWACPWDYCHLNVHQCISSATEDRGEIARAALASPAPSTAEEPAP